MDFLFSDDEHALRDAAREFARKELAPHAAAADESEAFPPGHIEKLAAFGAMGLNLPEEWGGAGASAVGLALAVEEIAAACAATASTVTGHYLASEAILLGADDALKSRYLRAAAAGRVPGHRRFRGRPGYAGLLGRAAREDVRYPREPCLRTAVRLYGAGGAADR